MTVVILLLKNLHDVLKAQGFVVSGLGGIERERKFTCGATCPAPAHEQAVQKHFRCKKSQKPAQKAAQRCFPVRAIA